LGWPRSEPAYGFIFFENAPTSGRRIASYTASQCCEISVMARAVARAAASRRAFTFSTSSRRFSIVSRRVRYPLTSRAMMSTSVTPESYAGESRAGSRFANRFAKPSKGSSSDRSLSHSSLVPKWCTARLAAPAAPVAFWWKHDKGSSVVTAAGQTSLRAEELVLDGERSRHRSIPVVWELAEEGRVDAQLGGAGDCVGPGGWPPSSPLLLVRSVCSRNGRIRSIGAGKMIVEELVPPISSNVCR